MPPSDNQQTSLLQRFVDTFHKGIDAEVSSMRERLGPFDIPLANPRRGGDPDDVDAEIYAFDLLSADERLVPQLECSLKHDSGEIQATIVAVDAREVTVRVIREIKLDRIYTLVIYPWFLYERLKEALTGLSTSSKHNAESALRLFGKVPPRAEHRELLADHGELNASQIRAVALAVESDLSFIWGPPGTGKTHTLGHCVTELIRQGERVLITSTTNAAVDQALAKLAELPETSGLFAEGLVVRIGQRSGETFGADLYEATRRQNERLSTRIGALHDRAQTLREEQSRCDRIAAMVEASATPLQFDIFRETQRSLPDRGELAPIFGPDRARTLAALEGAALKRIVDRHRERLALALKLIRARITAWTRELRSREGSAVEHARVVLATMTNLYLSPLLEEESFDAVIVEEAGMAILPAIFYAASLARKRVIAVGDPQQLPPIVQSNDQIVRRAIGRNIFEVTVPRPFESEQVALLDTQYRMHPRIGLLVSELYYEGRLRNGKESEERDQIAARRPFAGEPLVVMDVQGSSAVTGRAGSRSRSNETTARLCMELALEGVRDGLESVAIITPYVDQARLIRDLLGNHRFEAARIECRTVHRFQGSERDMVILDTVDAPPLSPGTLLASRGAGSSARNLINVGISRARGKLIVVSDIAYFSRRAPGSPISELLDRAVADGLLVEAFPDRRGDAGPRR